MQAQRRLSYLVQASPGDPPVYLTWLIRPSPGGVTIRLHVDEIEYPDDEDEAEDIWLPMLAALQRTLTTDALRDSGVLDPSVPGPPD